MSLLLRAVVVSRGLRCCVSSVNLQRFKVIPLAPSGCNIHRCKASLTLSSTLKRDYSTKVEAKSSDKTDDREKELIYTGMLSTNIRRIKFFSLSTSMIAVAIQPVIYQRALEATQTTALTIPLFGFIGFMAIATPLLLHIVTKRYILSVEYLPKEDKYIATTYNIFVRKKQVEFTPDDVSIPTVLGMFTTCAIKGKPMFLDMHGFEEPEHYARIMGYDKPLDLGVDTVEKDEKEEDDMSPKKIK